MTKRQMVLEIRRLHRGMPGIPDHMDGRWGWKEQPRWAAPRPAWLVALCWRRADLAALLDEMRQGARTIYSDLAAAREVAAHLLGIGVPAWIVPEGRGWAVQTGDSNAPPLS